MFMSKVFDTFQKVLGFLLSIMFFIIILLIILNFFITKKNNTYFSLHSGNEQSEDSIAILNISGPIISEPSNQLNFEIFKKLEVIYPSQIDKYFKELQSKKIKALIISINSPGGSVSASQKIYKIIKEFKNENNINIYFHTSELLASGGYWIALSGDKIFADYGTIIGSIGVKGPDWIYYNSPTVLSTGILGAKIESPNGIEMYSNIAGKYKDIFNPFRKPNNKETQNLQLMVDSIYDDFIQLVSKNRKIEKQIIKEDIGAMIFNTKIAINNHLIDDELDISEVINFVRKDSNLNSPKIIINKIKKNHSLIDVRAISSVLNYNDISIYNKVIKKKFCFNFKNEFSAVLLSSYSLYC